MAKEVKIPDAILYAINSEGDLQSVLKNDIFKHTTLKLKEAMNLHPAYLLTTRLIHCIARIVKQQAMYFPRVPHAKVLTFTQIKTHFNQALRRGIRSNITHANLCVQELVSLAEDIFEAYLTSGDHDKIFDKMYALALSEPELVSAAIKRICNPPIDDTTHYDCSATESGEDLSLDEERPIPVANYKGAKETKTKTRKKMKTKKRGKKVKKQVAAGGLKQEANAEMQQEDLETEEKNEGEADEDAKVQKLPENEVEQKEEQEEAYLPEKVLLMDRKQKPRDKNKKPRTDAERAAILKRKFEIKVILRVHAMDALKQCMDGVKHK